VCCRSAAHELCVGFVYGGGGSVVGLCVKGGPGLLARASGGATALRIEGVFVAGHCVVVWAVLVGFLLSGSVLCIVSPSIAPAVSLM
jgi:hypothetical protein